MIKKVKRNSMHCCETLQVVLEDGRSALVYASDVRLFVIHDRGRQKTASYAIDFCPFCGEEFPASLEKEWFQLAEQYQCEDGSWDRRKIPKKLRTDEWWKELGL